MRKWLIILTLIAVAIFGALWWLGQSLEQHKPADGVTELEIEHVF